MTISRMQMPRELRMGGGIMGLQTRQQYGLGSIVKSATKAVTGAVKGVAKGVSNFAKSDLGKAALLAAGGYYLGGGSLFGLQRAGMSGFALGNLPGASLFSKGLPSLTGKKTLGTTAKVFLGGSLLGGVLGEMSPEEQAEVTSGRNIGALRIKLADAYKNQRTFASAENEDAAIAEQVERDVSEYTSGAGGYAEGGRIGFDDGGYGFEQFLKDKQQVDKAMNMEQLRKEYQRQMQLKKVRDQRNMAAMGGRMNYAMGSDELVDQASGIMGLPQRTNKAGVKELDLRESGGFIPPVGVKEKADDIPAMLSNNEFVFTADAVRGMGNGNVNKGAQRMYDIMKKLEKGGRV